MSPVRSFLGKNPDLVCDPKAAVLITWAIPGLPHRGLSPLTLLKAACWHVTNCAVVAFGAMAATSHAQAGH